MLKSKRVLLVLSLMAPLAACGSATEANKSNFADAINADLAKTCIRVDFEMNSAVNSHEFPVSIETAQKTSWRNEEDADAWNRSHTSQFEALVSAGVLSRATGMVDSKYGKTQAPGTTYSLTDLGKKSLMKEGSTTFCAGTYEVIDVVSFTAPGQSLDGETLSTAQFTFKPRGVPDWVRAKTVQATFGGLSEALSDKQDGEASLILKNDGWAAVRSPF